RTEQQLHLLQRAEGKAGVAQRAAKGAFQNAKNAPMSGYRFGAGGLATGGAAFRDIESDKEVMASNVRNAGNKAMYARKLNEAITGPVAAGEQNRIKQIVVTPETADLDPEKDKDQIEVVERFSEKYFELVKVNSAAENQVFAQQQPEEELLVKLR